MTLWSGRFDAAPDPDAFDFGVSFGFDRALFEDDVTGSIAWTEALGAAGVLSGHDTRTIVDGLKAILSEGRHDPAFVSGPDEDVHSFVERKLIERIGDVGRRLHTGRSRNEQVSLDLRLYLRRRIPALQAAVATLVAACADQAERAGVALMPSYTHLRRAQPVLVAHYFLSHAAALRRDHARLAVAAAEADALTLGSGAVAGTSYDVDTSFLARALGFSRVVRNSIDASSDRDFVASFLYAASMTMVHLSRLAEDLIIFTGEEHGFFDLSDASATGSSMMPQKKNPDPLELVRGKSGRTIGRLTGWLATMKGLPSGYNKDLQEDKEAVFDAEATLSASIRAAHAVVSRLALNGDRTGHAASGLLLATDVADYLVARGMTFRKAHEVVGGLVRRLLAEGRDFSALTLREWQDASPLFGTDVQRAISALASVEARRTPQSTNPAAVRASLEECRQWLENATSQPYAAAQGHRPGRQE
jgi:argininosuccinate lyase